MLAVHVDDLAAGGLEVGKIWIRCLQRAAVLVHTEDHPLLQGVVGDANQSGQRIRVHPLRVASHPLAAQAGDVQLPHVGGGVKLGLSASKLGTDVITDVGTPADLVELVGRGMLKKIARELLVQCGELIVRLVAW